jgi:NAD(P)-dependent dehydrogenase (short-subunit alcohol dehydrogenase family)
MSLEGQTVLVTGAAGGIGRAAAKRFANAGALVCLVDQREQPLRDLKDELGPSAICVTADVSTDNSAKSYVGAMLESYGRIDMAFLNAGTVGTVAKIEETPLAVFDRVMNVNVRGVWLGLAELMPVMKRQRKGSVVMTSSITGVRGSTGQGAYVASKHAVIGIMKTAAVEGAADKVRVNAICPAPVDTEMMATLESNLSPQHREIAREKILSGIPLGRYATAEEIAAFVVFLASPDASYCTGVAYMIDGGGTAGPVR